MYSRSKEQNEKGSQNPGAHGQGSKPSLAKGVKLKDFAKKHEHKYLSNRSFDPRRFD